MGASRCRDAPLTPEVAAQAVAVRVADTRFVLDS